MVIFVHFVIPAIKKVTSVIKWGEVNLGIFADRIDSQNYIVKKKILLMLTLALVALAGCKKEPVPGPGGKTPSITFIIDRETGEQIVLGFDINETDLGDGFDPHVHESLLFPYGGIRNDDGSYSDVGTCSFMIVQSYFGFGMSGWGWYMFPGSVDTDYGYVRCIREKL